MKKYNKVSSSFRDRSGFLYFEEGLLYRYVSKSYAADYDLLNSSGLLKELYRREFLVPHEECDDRKDGAHATLRPEFLDFISYPYEWCFSQLRDAALLTLRIQKLALKHSMILKDASAYNVQFKDGHPVFIDILSFEKYEEGAPWVAYGQFCRHFLAPLALAAYVDIRYIQILRDYIDGIPLDLASKILPVRTNFNSLLFHIHIHSKQQKKYESISDDTVLKNNRNKLSLNRLLSIIDSLERTIAGLKLGKIETEWGDYYRATNYNEEARSNKVTIVSDLLSKIKPSFVVDLGGNTGVYSRLASNLGVPTICADIDPLAVEYNYNEVKTSKEKCLLPLILDLSNPTPAIGWANEERDSFVSRIPSDATILSLALIHHLAISNNVPLEKLARFYSQIAQNLIIEFVPKEDSQVKKLLLTREDIFPDYNESGFEAAFTEYFTITERVRIEGSLRTVYFLERAQK